MTLNVTNKKEICVHVKDAIQLHFANNPVNLKINGKLVPINITTTIAAISDPNPKTFKIKANLALKYAKKNDLEFAVYNKSLNLEQQLQKEIDAIEMVKTAINEDMVIPVFQRVKKKSGKDSFECLIRIKNNDKLISPAMFINYVQHTIYYPQLTKIMIRKSCEHFAHRQDSFSINFFFL